MADGSLDSAAALTVSCPLGNILYLQVQLDNLVKTTVNVAYEVFTSGLC